MAASVLEAAVELVRRYDLAALHDASDEKLCIDVAEAESLARQLTAIQVASAAEISDRSRREFGTAGLAQKHGCSTPTAFLEGLARISGAEASRRIHLGSALRSSVTLTGEPLAPRFPVLAEAVAVGEVGPEAATLIVRALDDVRRVATPDDLDIAESGLVRHAQQNRVQYVSDLAIVVRDRLDPDGVLPREQETKLRRGIQLGRERNGIVPIRGGLAPTTAALLKSVFDEANAPGAQPRFLSEEDRREGTVTTLDEDGTETVALRDLRTRDQRQHDVVDGLLRAGIRNTGLQGGQIRSTAEVTAHISLADLESGIGVGWIDGIHEAVSANTIQRLLCDSIFRKAILGNDGEVLAFGKARYPFSSAQRKAIIARDGDTCLLCDAPVAWTDTHHVQEFYTHGAVGETNVDNGVMLCPRDHDLIHHTEWQIKMVNGIPQVLAPPEIDPTQTWKRVGRPSVQFRRTG
jgi:Domain of unknown function (DUF222)